MYVSALQAVILLHVHKHINSCLHKYSQTHTNARTAGKQRPTLQPDLVSGVAESAATPLGKQRERESVQTLTSSHSHGILRRGTSVFINPPVSLRFITRLCLSLITHTSQKT